MRITVTLQPGQKISQYQLVEQVGAGGMGVVWKAEDTILGRTVAIKFLPTALLRNEQHRDMFLNEARLASSVSQSHIAQVYEFGREDELDFLVMEFVEGNPLSRFLQGRPLSSLNVANLGYQVASALTKAHQKGLVHRDLKPANILVTDEGEVKVVDFGLAMLWGDPDRAVNLEAPGTETQHTAIKIAGTPAYMSPEQVRGEQLDARSDIFSLGTVLYQMTTGQLPFRGDTQEILAQIQKGQPTPVHDLLPKVPIELDRIVHKALTTRRDDRYQNVEDLAVDLKRLGQDLESGSSPSYESLVGNASDEKSGTHDARVKLENTRSNRWMLAVGGLIVAGLLAVAALTLRPGTGPDSSPPPDTATPVSTTPRIVVLPFDNLGLPEDEYFAAGMTEEITTRLGAVSGLNVISRKSALQYAGTEMTIQQVGNELNVGYVLEGAVRWARESDGASRVRITPQLVRVSDNTQLWAETYDRVLEDVFEIQSEIAERVIEQLGITLLEHEHDAIDARLTSNIEAYQAYLKGLEYTHRPLYTRETHQLQMQAFSRAVELDPGFIAARAALSRVHSSYYHFGHDRTPERQARAKAEVDVAMELGPDEPRSLMAMGWYFYWCHKDYDNAMDYFMSALEGLPNDDELALAIGAVRRRQGRWEEALVELKRAASLGPRQSIYPQEIGLTYSFLRDYDRAEVAYRRSIELLADQVESYADLAMNGWLENGTTDGTRDILERMPTRDSAYTAWHTFFLELYEGNTREAISHLESNADEVFKEQFFYAPKTLLIGQAYDLLGERESALEAYGIARALLEREMKRTPDDHRVHSALGLALAGLGLKDEAVEAGIRAVQLYPLERDHLAGTPWLTNLALIYTTVGNQDEAIDLVERLLSIPSRLSVPLINLDPRWRPLHDHPRFRELLETNRPG